MGDPEQNVGLIAGVLALALHAGLGYGLSRMHGLDGPRQPLVVEVDVRKIPPPPPPVTPPEPPKAKEAPPPEPPKPKIIPVKKQAPPPEPPKTPPPNQEPPKEPPNDPPKPVFGVTMESTTTADSSFAVPVGNTTMIDPKKSGKGTATPLPAAPAQQAAKPEYKPVSELYIKSMPDIDSDACGRTIKYPDEAEQLGIEGDIRLKVALDERGQVHEVKVLQGLGHGLDEAAVFALKHKCKFSPAIATDGKAVPFVIQSYVFHFQIER